jgi:chemotaxis response regulator CheB
MPEAAIATGMVDHVLEPAQIVPHLLQLLADGIGNAEYPDR